MMYARYLDAEFPSPIVGWLTNIIFVYTVSKCNVYNCLRNYKHSIEYFTLPFAEVLCYFLASSVLTNHSLIA